MDKIIIRQVFGELPPPYCYEYTLEINLRKKGEITFEINYIDRDDISAEEILSEGFSEDDDFKWSGLMHDAWVDILADLPSLLKQGQDKSDLYITGWFREDTTSLIPKDTKAFTYLLQELIQAIYEVSEKQQKLSIEFLEIDGGAPESHSLVISFYQRKASMDDNAIPWNKVQDALTSIFSLDFDDFNASPKKPTKKGLYVNTGEGLWYRADSSIKTMDGKPVSKTLKQLVKDLIG